MHESAINVLTHAFLMRIVGELFTYLPSKDAYVIKEDWSYFGAEQLKRLEKKL